MRVIDLLNKIANGEEVPKKIRYKSKSYIYSNECKGYYLGTNPERIETLAEFRLVKRISHGSMLNDEIEIIEEDKKISKDIKWYLIEEQEKEKTKIAQINMNFRIIREKMGEIIDYINKEKK